MRKRKSKHTSNFIFEVLTYYCKVFQHSGKVSISSHASNYVVDFFLALWYRVKLCSEQRLWLRERTLWNAAILCGHAALHLNGGHTAHGVPMNRPGLTRDHIIWIKTGLPQKERAPHRVNQIKIKCCIQQIRLGRVWTLLYRFQEPPPSLCCLHPPASNSVKFTTTAAHASHNNTLYCCAKLSSQAFVFFDPCDRWGTHFFFCKGSPRRLPLDGPAPGWWPLRSS